MPYYKNWLYIYAAAWNRQNEKKNSKGQHKADFYTVLGNIIIEQKIAL